MIEYLKVKVIIYLVKICLCFARITYNLGFILLTLKITNFVDGFIEKCEPK